MPGLRHTVIMSPSDSTKSPILNRYECALVIITVFWGATFLIVQKALAHSDPFVFVGMRFGCAALAMTLCSLRVLRGLTALEVRAGMLIGLCIFLGYSLQTVGLQTIASSKSAFITALYVPLVPLMQWLFLKRPPTLMNWVGATMAFVGLVLLADPLMVGLFMRGAFDRMDAHGSAMALVAYGFGLPAFVLVRSLTPGFQARGDTRTPVKLGLIATAVNIGLKVALIGPFAQVGIATGTSFGAWLNVILLSVGLSRRGWLRLDAEHRALLRRCAWASAAMIAVLLAVVLAGARWSPRATMGTIDALAIVGLGGTAGLLTYALTIGAGRWRAIGDRFAGALRRR